MEDLVLSSYNQHEAYTKTCFYWNALKYSAERIYLDLTQKACLLPSRTLGNTPSYTSYTPIYPPPHPPSPIYFFPSLLPLLLIFHTFPPISVSCSEYKKNENSAPFVLFFCRFRRTPANTSVLWPYTQSWSTADLCGLWILYFSITVSFFSLLNISPFVLSIWTCAQIAVYFGNTCFMVVDFSK